LLQDQPETPVTFDFFRVGGGAQNRPKPETGNKLHLQVIAVQPCNLLPETKVFMQHTNIIHCPEGSGLALMLHQTGNIEPLYGRISGEFRDIYVRLCPLDCTWRRSIVRFSRNVMRAGAALLNFAS
jgi:hypothetical protein